MIARCRLPSLLVVTALLSGCALPYYWQAVGGQVKLLRKRTPIDAAVVDPAVDEATKANLQGVAELRRFAVSELGLPDNRSYTSYVDLGRDYVVWNVVAAEEFSVDPVKWCFPFAGCVAYRGYFDRADAERFERDLRSKGFDTYSGGSGAYSTLGYFADPVLNTMLAGGDEYIAGILFHELAHQRLYVKGDSELNEAFATTIEEYGVERWLEQQRGVETLDRYRERLQRRAGFADLVVRQQTRLRAIYADESSADEKRAAKQEAFGLMRSEYEQLKEQWNGAADYDGWFAQPLNNATLAAVATYRRWLPVLRRRLEDVGLTAFYIELDEVAKLPDDARLLRLEAWERASSASAGAAAKAGEPSGPAG